MRRFGLLVAGLALLAGVAATVSGGATQAEARWVITDLGTLGGKQSEALAINNKGQIVGWWGDIYNNRAFLWQDGKIRDLGTLGGMRSQAEAINSKGQIVGAAQTRASGSDTFHWSAAAFLWDRGKMRSLGTLGGKFSYAYDINERGQVVGTAQTKSGDWHAFLWESGKMRDLGVPGSKYDQRIAVGINDRGQIVGWSGTWYSGGRAWLWEAGRVRSQLLGGKRVTSIDINDRSQVVGTLDTGKKDPEGNYDDEPTYHAFLWQSGKLRDLTPGAVNGGAEGINDLGQIVGAWWPIGITTSDVGDQAVLWRGGKMISLPSLRVVTFGDKRFRIGHANAVNEGGQIVGWSDTKFLPHAVLWTKR